MQFENTFVVPLPPDQAWDVLLDVPRIAPCFPGAELTEALGEARYKGRAGVKVGPVNLFFAGQAEITDRNDEEKTARVKAKGNDTKGRGQASSTIDFSLIPSGEGSKVVVKTDLVMTGAVAQYGRAAGLMKEIAGALISEFAENLAREINQTGGDGTQAQGAQVKSAKPISALGLLGKASKAWVAGAISPGKDRDKEDGQ